MSALESEPWRELPPELTSLIEPELPALRDEVLSVIAEEVPEYARPLDGSFGRNIRLGVDEALRQFARLIADPDRDRDPSREVYRQLGAGEMREGRSLDALQAAYRVGARVTWRRLALVGLESRVEPAVLCSLADAIFAYVDELAADSVEGYAAAQQERAGERERQRRALVAALLADPWDEQRVRRAAIDADWKLPATAAALACPPESLERLTRRLPPDAVAGVIDDLGCAVVPDPAGPGRRALLEQAAEGTVAAIGRECRPAELSRSWAQAAKGLRALPDGDGLLVVEERLAEIALWEARDSLRALATQRLAPLEDISPAARERALATLRAFLDERGNAPAMASALHLHPQTVRYRLRRLRELFGDALDDPQARFELDAAVRVAHERVPVA